MKPGTAVSKVLTPIAGLVKADCYDPVTRDLRPESPCAKARARMDEAKTLREFGSAIFDRFWQKSDSSTMPNSTDKQPIEYKLDVAITAMNVQEAIAKLAEGEILSINPRPKPPVTQFGGGQAAAKQAPSGLGQTIVRSVK